MPVSPLESLEKLEQLRVLEAGRQILVGVIDEPTIGIDTEADYRAFVERMRSTRAIEAGKTASGSESDR
jgi:3-deoxy-manno-octulosonate cytidylyltransferase (CMP-KDO synthetase)